MENIKVKNIIISKQGEYSVNYEKLLEIVEKKNINVIEVKRGDRIYFDKYTYIDILWPNEKQIEENILNNNSIVMKLNYGNFKMLFTGDIEAGAEAEIENLYKNTNYLEADVLKVAHHGSKTSSSVNFLELVKPKIALIGCGKDNKYGHPNKSVLNRLEKLKTKIYRTDENGEISLYINKKRKNQNKKTCIIL